MAFQYDYEFVYLKVVAAVIAYAATVAITILVFTTSFAGIGFLNRGKRPDFVKHANIAKKLDNMSEEQLQSMLEDVRARKERS